MLDRGKLAKNAATFKNYASREFNSAVNALIDLVWAEKSHTINFLWDADPTLDEKANAILRGLSDELIRKAKALAEDAVRNEAEFYEYDEEWEEARERMDMTGSHLKSLLEIWIALAVANGTSKGELVVLISRYLNNPFASPMWRGLPKDVLAWGRGYDRNIIDQLAVIGQNIIVSSARYSEWLGERNKGAQYYIRHRGSGYYCPDCDSLCEYPIPIETPFIWLHSRCMCWPEYFYEPMPNV